MEKHGINGFYNSREARIACCHTRKVEPLNRALAGAQAWVVGSGALIIFVTSGRLLSLSPDEYKHEAPIPRGVPPPQ